MLKRIPEPTNRGDIEPMSPGQPPTMAKEWEMTEYFNNTTGETYKKAVKGDVTHWLLVTVNREQAVADWCKARIFKALQKLIDADVCVRTALIGEVSMEIQAAQEELKHVLNATMVSQIVAQTTTWMASAIQGKPIELHDRFSLWFHVPAKTE